MAANMVEKTDDIYNGQTQILATRIDVPAARRF